jgi:ABC-2 type transport system ATP-binding protein
MNLVVEHLSKSIRGALVLDDVNLTLSGGNIYGLKGPNGSGKTMLMRAVCGFIRPTAGCVIADGRVLGKDLPFPPRAGALIENPSFIPKYTGFMNLKLLAMIRNIMTDDEIRAVLEQVGLDPLDRRPYRKYSLGMKQRLGIAAALMEEPRLILLDEPINALDADGINLIRDLLVARKQQGALLIVSCHDAAELELLADKVFEMYEGRITGSYEVAHG